MKYLIVLNIVFFAYGNAQNLSGIIKYRFIYLKKPPENGKTIGSYVADHNIPAYLYFNSTKSLFVYDKEDYNKELNYQRKSDSYGQMYFADKNNNILYIREFIYRAVYITNEKIPVISWEIKNEVKTIAGYICKKAEAEFRGRKYMVWYTSAIPISVGPWKLQGLPGAILEAETEDGQVKFTVESIRIPADVEKELSIDKLPEGKIVTYEEYLEAFEKERKANDIFMYSIISPSLKEEVKKGTIKADPNSLKITTNPMFTIEKYK